MLRNHRQDFGMPQKNLAHLSRGRLAILQRKRDRHGSANPEVAFFQVGKKFAAQSRGDQEESSQRERQFDSDHESAVGQRKTQGRIVETVQQCGRRSFRLPSRARGAGTKRLRG